MLKVLLIDDEERATDVLRRMIEKFIPEIKQVHACNDARKALTIIHTMKPDLIFLDIRMPHLSGFDILDKLPNKNFKIIFTTAHDEYAILAIRFSAFDYLLKPVDSNELTAAVKRFIQTKEDNLPQPEQFKNIGVNMTLQKEEQFRLALPTKEGVHFLFPHEIARCEALGNYTKFYVTGNKQYTISKTLGEYEELLAPYRFIRTHKSHLVNRAFISFVDHDGFVILKDSTKIEVSRRRKEDVLKALKSK
jgi:two-component system LytT family response regulator